MITYLSLIILIISHGILVHSWQNSIPKGPVYFEFSASDYVKKLGYPLEIHNDIQTEDGYLLSMMRIPYGKLNHVTNGNPRPVVLLMHGLFSNGDCFFVLGENRSLPFLLSNRGYDIWVGHSRGTKYSRKHVRLDPDKDKSFWDFSLHELGYFDLPAFILYIKKITQLEKITYIGHSQGGTSLYIMGSTRPEFGHFFNLAIGLAPGVYYGMDGFPMNEFMAASMCQLLDSLRDTLDLYELGPQVMNAICDKAATTLRTCKRGISIVGALFQTNFDNLDAETLTRSLGVISQSSSFRQLFHYIEMIMRSEFRQYDYGINGNLQKYGQPFPPLYDLSKVVFPSAIYYGNKDTLVTTANTKRLIRDLPNVVYEYLVPFENFTHIDFVVEKDVVPLLYNNIISLMEEYKNKKSTLPDHDNKLESIP